MKAKTLWLVFAGGAIGSIVRAFATSFGVDLWATLAVNIVGAAMLGLVQTAPRFAGESSQAFWSTGFCGGFTTLSGLVLFVVFGKTDDTGVVLAYVLATVALGVAAYAAFARIGKNLESKTLASKTREVKN